MKLPYSEKAFVDIAKLRGYSLNPFHNEGKHKARVFKAALGFDMNDAEWLRTKLLEAAQQQDCRVGRKTPYRQRYLIDFTLIHQGKSAKLRSIWILRAGENFPRLVTCYVL